MSLSTVLPRVAVLVGMALAIAGCSTTVAGVPVPAAATPSVASPAPPSARPVTGGCKVTLGPGRVSISGGGGRAVTTNGATSFSCRSGPLIAVGPITDGSVSFDVNGVNATITVDSTVGVGPYQITVVSIVDGTATLQVVPAG